MVLSDFTRPPDEIIVDLINYDNGTSLLGNELTFGLPIALVEGRHNTRVVVTAKPISKYTGEITISYNRVDLEDVPKDRSKTFEDGTALTIADLIPAINAAYNLTMTSVDFIDAPLPQPQGEFDLIAGPNSLIFQNKVTLTLVNGAGASY